MRRQPVGYYELNGERHTAFHNMPIPKGAVFREGAVPGPSRTLEEEQRDEIAARLPDILYALKDEPIGTFASELQRRVKEAAESKARIP